MTGLIIKGVLALVALAALAWGVHLALEHFREQGRVEQRAIDDPIIAKLRADKATLEANQVDLKAAVANLSASVQGWQDQAQASKAQAQTALARIAAQAKAYEATIADLSAKASAPPTVDYAQACRQAEALIDRLLTGSGP